MSLVVEQFNRPLDGEFALHIPCVQGSSRLEEQDTAFRIGDRAMFHATGHDHKLASRNIHAALLPISSAVLHLKRAAKDEEHLVGIGMMVPHERALELGKFDVLAVQLAHDPWTPMLTEGGERVVEPYFLHVALLMN